MRQREGGGQVEEIDAEMNKTWAKERKVTDQLETFKNWKENAQHKYDMEILSKWKVEKVKDAFSVSPCVALFVSFDKKLIQLLLVRLQLSNIFPRWI